MFRNNIFSNRTVQKSIFNRKKFFKRLPTGKILRRKIRPKEISSGSNSKIFVTLKPNRNRRLKSKLVLAGLILVFLAMVAFIIILIFRPELPSINLNFNSFTSRYISPSLPKPFTREVKVGKSFEEQITEQLNPDLFKVREVRKVEEGVEFSSDEEIKVIFSTQKDPTYQVTSLQVALSRARIEGKKVKKIDFRFDKLVVEYQ